jgi:voltage-gated potassium channel
MPLTPQQRRQVNADREDLLQQLNEWLDGPMTVLAFVWLALFIIEIAYGESRWVEITGEIIWGIFILDFLIKFFVAPDKLRFFKRNVITAISLVLPAFRVLRVVRVLRALRFAGSARVVQVVGSVNRSMRALRRAFGRRQFAYVMMLSVVVCAAGAAGMLALENDRADGIHSYSHALYWTAMLVTTIGSEYWPHSVGGRILALLLSLYAVAIVSYLAATLASFFIDREADSPESAVASDDSVKAVLREVEALRREVALLRTSNPPSPAANDE